VDLTPHVNDKCPAGSRVFQCPAASLSLSSPHFSKRPVSSPLGAPAISSSYTLLQQPTFSPDAMAVDAIGAAPLPPNPSVGSSFYGQNWRNPTAANLPSSFLPIIVAGSPFTVPNLSTSHPTPTRARQLAATPPLPASPDMLWRMRACRSSNWHGDPRRGQSSRWASGPVARDMPWSVSDQPSTTLRTDYGDECDFTTDLRTPSIFSELFLLMRNIYD
jgi:hypothetical protein